MNISNLRHADDNVLLAENQEYLQKLVGEVHVDGQTYNLNMDTEKTKTIVISRITIKPALKSL